MICPTEIPRQAYKDDSLTSPFHTCQHDLSTEIIHLLDGSFSQTADTPFPEKSISHVREFMSDCPTDVAIRGEIDKLNDSLRHYVA